MIKTQVDHKIFLEYNETGQWESTHRFLFVSLDLYRLHRDLSDSTSTSCPFSTTCIDSGSDYLLVPLSTRVTVVSDSKKTHGYFVKISNSVSEKRIFYILDLCVFHWSYYVQSFTIMSTHLCLPKRNLFDKNLDPGFPTLP